MDFGQTVLNLAILIGLVVLLIVAVVMHQYLTGKKNEKFGKNGKPAEKPTTILDEKDDRKKCEICYGTIDDDAVAVCRCNRIFHAACAKPTGFCPYCNTGYEDMMVREPERTRCPKCGRFIGGNTCQHCELIFSSGDRSFKCKCGNTVDYDKPVCKNCGTVYEHAEELSDKR